MPANRLSIKSATWMVALISTMIAVLAISASAALAASPWWGVTSGSRPTYFAPGGEGTDEVQEISGMARLEGISCL
jgi:hypothetical protein